MPHKRNPIGCEQIVGLARLLRGNAHGRARERRALARARHLALVGRARDPAGQLHRARPHAAALHAHRRGHGRLPGADAREPRALARRRVLRARCCSSWRGAACRASRRTSGCSATPCGRSTSRRDFKALLLADADVTARAAAGGDRTRVRPGRAAAERRRDFRRACSAPCRRDGADELTMRARVFVTLKPSVFDPQGQTHRRRAALARLRRRRATCGRASTSSSSSTRRSRDDARGAGDGDGRQAAGQSGDRELSRRGAT